MYIMLVVKHVYLLPEKNVLDAFSFSSNRRTKQLGHLDLILNFESREEKLEEVKVGERGDEKGKKGRRREIDDEEEKEQEQEEQEE